MVKQTQTIRQQFSDKLFEYDFVAVAFKGLEDADMDENIPRDESLNENNKLDIHINLSGNVCNTLNVVNVCLQFDLSMVCPRTRETCDCIDDIKSACA